MLACELNCSAKTGGEDTRIWWVGTAPSGAPWLRPWLQPIGCLLLLSVIFTGSCDQFKKILGYSEHSSCCDYSLRQHELVTVY